MGTRGWLSYLLARDDVEVDSKDNDGRTPLSWAADTGHEEVVSYCGTDGVDVDSKDNGWSDTAVVGRR
jgi:ankyrin repeat protein